jgi:hypothetical protein
MQAAEAHNIALLAETGKDIRLLEGVYGKPRVAKARKARKASKR